MSCAQPGRDSDRLSIFPQVDDEYQGAVHLPTLSAEPEGTPGTRRRTAEGKVKVVGCGWGGHIDGQRVNLVVGAVLHEGGICDIVGGGEGCEDSCWCVSMRLI